jgi:hypothetical protein
MKILVDENGYTDYRVDDTVTDRIVYVEHDDEVRAYKTMSCDWFRRVHDDACTNEDIEVLMKDATQYII